MSGDSLNRSLFLDTDADRRRLPVMLLSGFLGSGKTTLINRLLKQPVFAGTAVAVNEFGAIPLDQHLIDSDSAATVVLGNGCLCCNLGDDVEKTVLRLFQHRASGAVPSFQRLIIEPSGLADPAPITQAILRNPLLSRLLRLEAIVTVVDAQFGLDQLTQHPEARKQVAFADQIVISKRDMADDSTRDRLEAVLRGLNPAAPRHDAVDGRSDSLVLPPAFLDPQASATGPAFGRLRLSSEESAEPSIATHGAPTSAVCLVADEPLDWRAFDAWLRPYRLRHADQILRIKGLLNVGGGPVVLHGVHHVLHPPVALAGWPDADRRSRLVFITQGLPRGLLESAWTSALPTLAARTGAAA